MSDRTPPHSIDAEQAVLGASLLDPASIPKVSDWLAPEAFYRRDHRLLWSAILSLAAQGKTPDTLTVFEQMQADAGEVDPAYVLELVNTTASAANLVSYAEIVAEKAKLRRVIDVGITAAEAAWKPGASSAMVVAKLAHSVADIGVAERRGGLAPAKVAVNEWLVDLQARFDASEDATGIAWPWKHFNREVGAMEPGQLVILCGRPSMGKTAFALEAVRYACKGGINTAFFSMETTKAALMRRIIAAEAFVPLNWLKYPNREIERDADGFGVDYMPKAGDAARQIASWPLVIDDSGALTAAQMAARTDRAAMHKPVGLIVVDHLHLIPQDARTVVRGLGDTTRDLKELGKRHNAAVLLLSQLNRGLEARANKRPLMSDLRESGAIEQDADLIVSVYRDEYYDKNTTQKGVVEAAILKSRDGESGRVFGLSSRFQYMQLLEIEGWNRPEEKVAPQGRQGLVA